MADARGPPGAGRQLSAKRRALALALAPSQPSAPLPPPDRNQTRQPRTFTHAKQLGTTPSFSRIRGAPHSTQNLHSYEFVLNSSLAPAENNKPASAPLDREDERRGASGGAAPPAAGRRVRGRRGRLQGGTKRHDCRFIQNTLQLTPSFRTRPFTTPRAHRPAGGPTRKSSKGGWTQEVGWRMGRRARQRERRGGGCVDRGRCLLLLLAPPALLARPRLTHDRAAAPIAALSACELHQRHPVAGGAAAGPSRDWHDAGARGIGSAPSPTTPARPRARQQTDIVTRRR